MSRRRMFTPRLKGARFDNSTDDHAAVNAAVLEAQAAGGGDVYLPGIARMNSQLLTFGGGIRFVGDGPERSGFVWNDVAMALSACISIDSGFGTAKNLTANADEGSSVVVVADTTGIAAGQDVYITDTSTYGPRVVSAPTFISRIAKVNSGTTFTLEDVLPATFTTASAATIRPVTLLTDIRFEGLSFEVGNYANSPALTNVQFLILASKTRGLKISDCVFEGAETLVQIAQARDAKVRDCHFNHARAKPVAVAQTGLSIVTSSFTTAQGNHFHGCAGGIDVGYSPYSQVIGNTIGGGSYNAATLVARRGIKLEFHSNYSKATGNIIENMALYGVYVDDAHSCSVIANTIHVTGEHGIALGDDVGTLTYSCVVSDNLLKDIGFTGISLEGAGKNIIANNLIENIGQAGGAFSTHAGIGIASPSNEISGNRISGVTDDQTGYQIDGTSIVPVANNRISGGRVRTGDAANRWAITIDPAPSQGNNVFSDVDITGERTSGITAVDSVVPAANAPLTKVFADTPVTLRFGDRHTFVNAVGGAVAVTLSQSLNGNVHTVRKTEGGVNNVTLTPATGTIDGAANLVLTAAAPVATIACDGTNWFSL